MLGQATSAVQDYVKAIHDAGGADQRVMTGAIAKRLSLHMASVTGMLQRLAAAGWIEYQPRHGARLTGKGLAEARRVVRRHQLIECFLVRVLGYDWTEVHAEAEALEHAISPRLERALAEYLGEPAEGPFGHPIPAGDGGLPRRLLHRLCDLRPGQSAVVREVEDRDPDRLRRWKALGLVPGAAVLIVDSEPLDGVMALLVGKEHIRVSPTALVGLRGELNES